MAKIIQLKGITLQSPEGQKYIADFLKVLPTLPPEEQEAVRKLEQRYKDSPSKYSRAMLDWAMDYLDSGILPTTSWDFEEMF